MEDQQGRRIFSELYSINRGISTNILRTNERTYSSVSPYSTGTFFESTSSSSGTYVHYYPISRSPPTATVGGVLLFSTVVRVILQLEITGSRCDKDSSLYATSTKTHRSVRFCSFFLLWFLAAIVGNRTKNSPFS